ncbi:G/T mismatch-specific thymine DNA glycosylase-like [Xenia sp. Carnegie-2017]|uniref:G/T mismatch-specific thymine DNA glycosylase-like n=1 Tax=Xenia sp. Carnegie-2017 TaxID=2897299 RepID=UPI001F0410C0|nr:G/T mismatch-specific thymine DNA glycosylase-like [Xenia sp. Carnegie-2017]XP_046840180.1 G/T mismatch-specific thymine DNA glycosylase-like [Xenia sp. Carnegie-2017]
MARYSPYFQQSPQKASRKKGSGKKRRFGDMSEDEVTKLLLPDHFGDQMDIMFVGINPGLMSAYKGHHYSGQNNHFWPCLADAGLVPDGFTFVDDVRCPDYGIGLTNIVARTTKSSSELSRQEIKKGKDKLIEKIKIHRPLVTCFNGKGIYEIFAGRKCELGLQKERVPGTSSAIYVMPSSSARTMIYPRKSDKLQFYLELKKLKDELKAEGNCID